MKRILKIVLICTLLVGTMTSSYAVAADKNLATISVTGSAKIPITPNVAYLNLGVTTTGADVESTRTENESIMRRTIEGLIAQGIDRKMITTSQFSLQPMYNNEGRDTVQRIIGYRLQNNVTVAIEELSSVGTVIDTAFRSGVNQFNGLRFGLKNDSSLREELLRKAVQDGRHKAQIIADALGVTLGYPLSVSEAGGYVPMQADSYQMMKTAAGAPIEAGMQTVSLNVNLVFTIAESNSSK
ncbi:MAG: hypothetical protein H6Q76_1616 [Firmicutes bacterium]|nr:hypothetical protein [Bacillota bacterium]